MTKIELKISEKVALILLLEKELRQAIRDDFEVAELLNEHFPKDRPHRNYLTESKIDILNKLEDGRGDCLKQEVIKSLTDEA